MSRDTSFQRHEETLGKTEGGEDLFPGTLHLPKEQKCLAAITIPNA
jgi:hypothetical protein